MSVKAATVEKTESKRAAPPSRLPYHQRISAVRGEPAVTGDESIQSIEKEAFEPPRPIQPSLPTLEETTDARIARPPAEEPVKRPLRRAPPVRPAVSSLQKGSTPEPVDSQKPAPIKKPAPPPNLPFV